MAERTERGVLNMLIVTCRDAHAGFTFAADHCNNATVRTLLLDLAAEHSGYVDALLPHAERLGGDSAGDHTAMAALHRAWTAVKDKMGGHRDQAMVAEAEHGVKAALAAYDEAIGGMLPPETRDLVEAQRQGVASALARLQAVGVAAA